MQKIILISLGLIIKFTLFAQPTADFSFSPTNPCSGDPVTFTNQSTGTGSISYLWEFGDGNTSNQANPTHIYQPAEGNGSQTFTIRLTASQGGETHMVTQTIFVGRPPSTELVDPNNWPEFSKCAGDGDFNLTVQNNSSTNNMSYTIDWGDGSTPFTSNDFSSTEHTYTSPGLFDLIFTVDAENGCSASDIYTVLYGSNPVIGVTGPEGSVGCAPLELTYQISDEVSGNVGTSYTFQFDDGSDPYEFTQDNIPTSITHQFTEASCGGDTDFYTLAARAENQCGYQQITIEPIGIDREPIALISAPDTVCVGEIVTFINSHLPPCGGNPSLTNFVWIIDGVEDDVGTSTASQTHTFETPGIKTVSLRASNTTVNHCSDGTHETSIEILVIESDVPDPPSIDGPINVCQGEQGVAFTASTVDHADEYIWDLPDGVSIVSGLGTNSIVVNFAPTTPIGQIEFRVRGVNLCSEGEESDVFEVIVSPLPANPSEIIGITSICEGQEVILLYEIDEIDYTESYIWEIPAGTQIVSSEPHGNAIDVEFLSGFSSGYIRVRGENNCGLGIQSSAFVSVSPIPANAVSISGPDEVCEGEVATFTVPVISHADEYVWNLKGEEVITSVNSVNVAFETPGEASIQVYGRNPCGDGGETSKLVMVSPGPKPNFSPQDHCFGQPVPLFQEEDDDDNENDNKSNGNPIIILWEWDFGDGYSSTKELPEHVYDSVASYTITLRVITDKGCPGEVSDTVHVQPVPSAYFWAHGMVSLNEQGPMLSRHNRLFSPPPVRASMINPTITFIDSTIADNTTEWTFDPPLIGDNAHWYWESGEYDQEDNIIIYEGSGLRAIQHRYSKPGSFEVKHEVTSAFGCSDSSFVKVQIIDAVYVPNAFIGGGGGDGGAIDGDGELGVFKPIFGWDEGAGELGYEFKIFNRWGEQVFFSDDYEEGWDGTVRGGKDAPGGVYVWRLKYRSLDGRPIHRTGNVLLLR